MKKLLALILAMLMCLVVFASCTDPAEQETEAPTTGETDPENGTDPEDGTNPEDDTDPEGDEYDVGAAAEYVDTLYKSGNTVTASDYEVFGQVMIGTVKYTIVWTVNNELVKVVEGSPYWTIDVDEKAAEEHTYTLTGTITAPDGTTATVSYERTVPKYAVLSFDEYMAAEEGATVVIEGIVVAINSKSLGNTRNHLFLADASGKGGYYCYQFDNDPVEAGVEIGMTVSVTAVVSPYSGMQETKGGTFTIVDKTIKTVAPLDITDEFAAGTSLKNYVGLPVVINGVELGSQDLGEKQQYLYFSLNNQKGYVRSYVTDFPTTLKAEDKTTIDADHLAHFGWKANVTGILLLYSGAPYLLPMSATPFTDYEEVKKTPAEMIEIELGELDIPTNVAEDTTIELPLAGKHYSDVTFDWAVDNNAYTVDADGKLAIALTSEKVTLTLTATITCGETTETKTFTVEVAAKAAEIVTPTVQAPAVGTAFKFVVFQNNLGKTLYFTGKTANQAYYLATSTNVTEAVDVYVEAVDGVEGGYRLYFLDGETKTYIRAYERQAGEAGKGKGSLELTTTLPTEYYTYDETMKTLVITSADNLNVYYLGCYSEFDTISCSNSSYVNADNLGVSQFPAGLALMELVDAEEEPDNSGSGENPDSGDNSGSEQTPPVSGETTTVSVSIADVATANGWANSTLYASFDLDDNVTVSASGTPVGNYGLNTGKFYTNGNNWRIYQNETPSVTITAEGKTIVSVKITYDIKNTGTLTLNGENVASDTVITVNAESITFSVGNTGTATNGQAQITAIEVVYQ